MSQVLNDWLSAEQWPDMSVSLQEHQQKHQRRGETCVPGNITTT